MRRAILVLLGFVVVTTSTVTLTRACEVYVDAPPPTCCSCQAAEGEGWTICEAPSCWGCVQYGQQCGGGGSCFLADTPIATKDGMKPIDEIEIGDEVLGMSETGELVHNRVVRTYSLDSDVYYVLNGTIRVTGTHPFKFRLRADPVVIAATGVSDWQIVEELEIGDELLRQDGTWATIESIEIVEKRTRVYNLEVANDHNFFAHGFLVHNKDPGQEL